MAGRRWWIVLGLFACGGDDTPSPTGRPRLEVALPGSTAGTLPIHIEVRAPRPDHTLYVAARGPGDGIPGDGVRTEHTGVRPATGPLRWLAPDGTWSDARVALQTVDVAAPVIDLAPPLPTTDEGSWVVQVELRSPDDAIIAFGGDNTLVSSTPALALSIDRLWAMGDDPVSVNVRTAPAGRDVAVVAWLTLPDGRELALPGFESQVDVTPIDDRVRLLDTPLGAHGVGDFRVSARLIDRGTGEYLAAGGATFTVCDTRGRVTGVVRDDAGTPIGGGTVELTSVSRGYFDARRADVDGSGAFAIEDVPVGAWTMRAAGDAHASEAVTIQIGCAGPTTVDVAAAPRPTGAMRRPLVAPDAPTTSDQCKATRDVWVLLLVENGVHSPPVKYLEEAGNFDFIVQLYGVALGSIGLLRSSQDDIATLLTQAKKQQGLGGDDTKTITGAANAVGSIDFLLLINFGRVGDSDFVQASFTNIRTGVAVRGHTYSSTPGRKFTDVEIAGVTDHLGFETLADDLRRDLLDVSDPKVELSYSPAVPKKGSGIIPASPVTFRTVVTDRQTCGSAGPGIPVEIITQPAIPLERTATDSKGIATVKMTEAPSVDDLTAYALINVDGTEYRSPKVDIRYQPLGNVLYELASGRVPPNEIIKGTIATIKRQLVPTGGVEIIFQPLKKVTLKAKNGLLRAVTNNKPGLVPAAPTDEIEVTTNEFGRAAFEFHAGATPGAAPVEALTEDSPMPSRMVFFIEPPLAISLSPQPQSQVLVNNTLALEAFVDLPNGKRGVGIDVAFSVTSGGGTVQTVIGKTGVDGRASALYLASSLPGAVTVRASARLDGFLAHGDANLTVRAPCTGCPIILSSDRVSCPKGAKVFFTANQLVTWSAQGGEISKDGVYTCGQMGGEFTVTASSVENPGTQGTRKIMIIPTAAELAMAAVNKPVMQNVVADPAYCIGSGMSIGAITITDLPPPAADDQVEIEYKFDDDCIERFGAGVQLPPRISAESGVISQSFVDNITGCPIFSISVAPVGPGLSGFAGSIFLGNGQLVNGNFVCTTRVSAQFGP